VNDLESLVVLAQGAGRRPLFCMHPIGGHVGEYRWLAGRLAPELPIFAIASRARRDDVAEHASYAGMATSYVDLVQRAQSAGPYRLAGWSMGALTAHSVACVLEERGATVELLAMFDPQFGPVPPAPNEVAVALLMAIQIFHPSPPPRPIVRRTLQELSNLDIEKVPRWAVERGLLPPDVDEREVTAALRMYPAHGDLVASFRPGVCRAPIRLWQARQLGSAPRHDWATSTSSTCSTTQLAADHFTIMRPPHVVAIASDLNSTLAALS
jgi:thioesterase domain-containing protein